MKIEYRGYTIEVKAKRTDGVWAADIRLWLGNKSAEAVKGANEVEGYNGQQEAEAVALRLAKDRVDLYVLREL